MTTTYTTKTTAFQDELFNTYFRSLGVVVGDGSITAFLTNNPTVGASSLTPSSTMTTIGIATYEVADSNGYARQTVDMPASSGGTIVSSPIVFTCTTGTLGPFTYIGYIRAGSSVTTGDHNNTTGTLIGFRKVQPDGSPITLAPGQVFSDTLSIVDA